MRYRLQRFCISTAGKSESENFRYRARLDTTHRTCVCVGIVCVINKGVCQMHYWETISEKSKAFMLIDYYSNGRPIAHCQKTRLLMLSQKSMQAGKSSILSEEGSTVATPQKVEIMKTWCCCSKGCDGWPIKKAHSFTRMKWRKTFEAPKNWKAYE